MLDNSNLFAIGAIVVIVALIIHNAIQQHSITKLTEFVRSTPTELIDLGKTLAKDVISVDTMQQIIATGNAVKTYTPQAVDDLIDAVTKLTAQLADKTNLLPPAPAAPPTTTIHEVASSPQDRQRLPAEDFGSP